MSRSFRISILSIVGLLLFSLGGAVGILLDRSNMLPFLPPQPIVREGSIDYALIAEAWRAIEQHYVDRDAIQPTELTRGAIDGLVQALGDIGHSRFLAPSALRAHSQAIQGEFEGIGVEVQMKAGALVIVAPIDDSPAQRAGLKAGEIIAAVNGESLDQLSLDEAVQRILGPAGTEVELTILNPETNESREVKITRAKIALRAVTWSQIPETSIAHVRIASFSKDASTSLKQTLQAIQAAGLRGMILDLRNNPGGLLAEAIATTSQFLTDGNVLQVKDAQGRITAVPVEEGGVAPELPMIVLVNNGSASSAEIVSGALQDQNRATVVGQRTFGTGTVLNQFNLADGSALLLATQLWLTPNGRVIWHEGLDPDVMVELPPDVQPLFPTAIDGMTLEQIKASGDQQLVRALELLDK